MYFQYSIYINLFVLVTKHIVWMVVWIRPIDRFLGVCPNGQFVLWQTFGQMSCSSEWLNDGFGRMVSGHPFHLNFTKDG